MTSIGVKPNQIPVNGMLGTMAFQDAEAVNISAGKIGAKSVAELNNAAEDAREWTAETVSEDEARGGTSTTRRAWNALRVFQAIAAWWADSEAKQKLDNIAAEATKNESDEHLLDRTNHTGTQAVSTVEGLETALELKADLNSPTFAGDPKAPTPDAADNDTSIATTAFVRAAMGLFGLNDPSAQQAWHAGNFDPAAKQDARAVITKSGANETSVLSDAGGYLRFTGPADSSYTVAPQSAVPWPANAEIMIRRVTAGTFFVKAGTGVTLNINATGTTQRALNRFNCVLLKRVAVNEWDMIEVQV